MGFLARLRGKFERIAVDVAEIRATRNALRTLFVIEGGSMVEGLELIDSRYPGIAQPGDLALGTNTLDRLPDLWVAKRDGKRCVKWQRVTGWTTAELAELRRLVPHVLTVDVRDALPP